MSAMIQCRQCGIHNSSSFDHCIKCREPLIDSLLEQPDTCKELIRSWRRDGIRIRTIRQRLTTQGWSVEEIDTFITDLSKEERKG